MALDPVRRARILQAATALFSSYGYRRTSMDLLASEADVAKPTLYAYFSDKESVFVAVVEEVLDAILADAEAASQSNGSLEERLTGVLASKFTRLFELAHSSPHAADLLTSSQVSAKEAAERTDAAYRACLDAVIGDASRRREIHLGAAGVTRAEFVEALMQGGYGAAALASSTDDHRRRIGRQVHLLVSGVQVG